MLNFLPSPLIAILNCALLTTNIIIWCSLLFVFTFIKLLLPIQGIRKILDPVLISIAEAWITGNKTWMRLTHKTQWDIKGLENLKRDGWYLVSANHQSWVDIFVLQSVFNRKIPFLKFFLKQELLHIPVMGQAWWALDFPFMKRYSKSYLEKHPEKRGKDLETTRKACERFSLTPTSVMNFVEGTRFSEEKKTAQKSPYTHLLNPKAGGLGFAISALGEKFHSMLDITIVYPEGAPSFWQFLSGQVFKITVHIKEIEIPKHFTQNDYMSDTSNREQFQQWLINQWKQKDTLMEELINHQCISQKAE